MVAFCFNPFTNESTGWKGNESGINSTGRHSFWPKECSSTSPRVLDYSFRDKPFSFILKASETAPLRKMYAEDGQIGKASFPTEAGGTWW